MEKKLNILVVSQYFWPENFRVNDLVNGLLERGHRVTVLTAQPNYPEGVIFKDYKENAKNFQNYNGAKIVRVPIFPRGNSKIKLLLNYISFFVSGILIGVPKIIFKRYDVVFVNQLSPVSIALPGIVYSKLRRRPLVMWVLDLWPESLSAVGEVKNKLILKLIGWMVSFIYRNCTIILVQSQSFMTSVSHYCKNMKKVFYFPNWAEGLFRQTSIADNSENNNEIKILFAGNIGDAQDFPAILKAVEKLKSNSSIKWLILGDGRAKGWVDEQIKQGSLSSNILMLGRHPLEDMPKFYAEADAFLVSLKDTLIFSQTLPGKVQTYLAAGKPIIGMLNGEGARVIMESKAGFHCAAGDADGLVDCVNKLQSLSRKERLEMGENGIRYYKNNFEREMVLDKFETILRSVA